MAEAVRPRPLTTRRAPAAPLVALLGALPGALAACGEPDATGASAPAGARAVDVGAIADDALVAAVLDECHRPLRQRMRNVRVTMTGPDGQLVRMQAALPDRARVERGASTWLWRDGRLHRLHGDEPDADARALVPQLVQLVDAAAFGPLYRARACRREGGGYALEQPDGAPPARLWLHEGTLLPARLAVGETTVRFEQYLRTSVSWVARTVSTPALGSWRVVFDDGGLVFTREVFALPGEIGDDPTQRMPMPGAVVETPSPVPIVVDGKASRWVLLADDGDWATRHERYRPVLEELERQDQKIAGFPLLWQEGDARWLGAPFRQRPRGPAFAPPPDWRIRDVEAGRLLVVYPPTGTVDERIAAGRAELRRALENRGLVARGPITAQPFVHLQEGVPDAAKLADTRVRVAVRIE